MVVGSGLLIVVGPLVAEHQLSGTWAQLFHGMYDLPRSGTEPTSPALAGGFLITGPPGKSRQAVYPPLKAGRPEGPHAGQI